MVITGASRGIGRALALAVATRPDTRLWLVARDGDALAAVAADVAEAGGRAEVVVGDLGTVATARALGQSLVERVGPATTLVHNAGLWPTRLQHNADGLEVAFAINGLAGLAMQAPLLAAARVARVMVVSAGLIVKGNFDPDRTPTGDDFSVLRTYCTTKLVQAIAMRRVAAEHPELDMVVLHPGVVRTDLGALGGPLGWLAKLVKRMWEDPAVTGRRLADILAQPRWSEPGEARWMFEDETQPWPEVATDPATTEAVMSAVERRLA